MKTFASFGLMTMLAATTAIPAFAGTLADMKPQELRVATIYGPDNWFSKPMEAYTKRIEERTGGKLTFEYFYAGSLVPAKEMASALGAGMYDFGFIMPSYEPAKFSVDEWQGKLAIPTNADPMLEFVTTGLAGYEWTAGLTAHTAQFHKQNIFPVMPSFSITGPYGLLCKDKNATLQDLAGKRSRVAGSTWTGEAQNVGLTPVSLPITEVYQAFQSGVIDCWMGGIADAGANGFFDHGKHFNLAVGLTAYSQAVYAFNKDVFEDFPQEVKEIIWDETAQYAAELLHAALIQQHTTAKTSVEQGVTYPEADPDLQAKVTEYHAKVRAEAADNAPSVIKDPKAEVERLSALRQKWQERLTGEFGFAGTYSSWGDIVAKDAALPDFAPLKAAILEEIVKPYAAAQQ